MTGIIFIFVLFTLEIAAETEIKMNGVLVFFYLALYFTFISITILL